MKRLLLILFIFSSAIALHAQGVTTSSIKGLVADAKGEALIGATVVAKHKPTGSIYGAITDLSGNYRIPNMKVGGPYIIEISYVGYGTQNRDEVYLRLGEVQSFDFTMQEEGVVLEEAVVVATAGTTGEKSGTSTQISSDVIEKMPTLSRNITDFTRLTPQASTTGSGISFGGINNRYNAIYVDGAVNNDVFGLAGSGTNGGQTGISPFSIDIIDQFQVVLSPYDVTLGGFAGGGINAVTKSGTNDFQGTLYFFNQNENLVGKTNGTLVDRFDLDREKVAEFSQNTYGFSLGGPLVKNKLFFFTNVEIQNDVTPIPFDLATYTGESADRVTEADLNNLRDHLITTYNYDPGTFGNTSDELKGVKLFGKLDFNLNDKNKLTVRHQYTKAEQFNRNGGSSRRINFSNNGIFFPSITNSSAIELNSRFGNTMSNNLILGFTHVKDDRDPLGDPFPYVIIDDAASGSIRFGSEPFSTANFLQQQIFTLTDNFKIFKGNHTFTIGTHNEFYDIRNVFLPWNYGQYEYNSLDDFMNGAPADDYRIVYSLIDGVAGDETQAAAEFGAIQLGIYGQDEYTFNNRLTLTAGLRIDVPILTTDPAEPPRFNSEVLPRLLAAYNGNLSDTYEDFEENVEAGKAPSGQIMLSPRIGFTYKTSDRSKFRGGVGVFTSRIPFVWPGAMYNTNGLTSTFLGAWGIQGDVLFKPDVQNQYTFENPTIPSGDMNLFTKDFKYPQVLRGNLAYDATLGEGWNTSLEVSYTKTLNNIRYTNINTSPEVQARFTGSGDTRPIFKNEELDEDDFGAVYLASNTNQGYAYNVTASVNKEIIKDFNFSLAYSYNDAYALFEGTSSQNSSQWRGAIHINGRNNPEFGRSDFAIGHRIISSLDYTIDWAENISTTFSIFYNGQSGIPISYVIGGDRDARNLNNERGSTSRYRSLIYVPIDQNDIHLIDYTDGNETITAAQQWENLNAFIESDPHLSQRRGGYAAKNGGRAPWGNFIDFAIRQDFSIAEGGKVHKFQLSFDVFNLANLINKDWGLRYSVPGSFNNYELLDFEGFMVDADGNETTIPQYTYRDTKTGKDAYDINDFASRWKARIGLRYIFK